MPPSNNSALLDVGCGEGDYLILAKKRGYNTIGIDIDQNSIRIAKERANSKVILMDARDIGFKDAFFDVVLLIGVLEHIDEEGLVLSQIFHILKNDGIFIIAVPNKSYPFLIDPENKIRMSLKLKPKKRGYGGGPHFFEHKRLYTKEKLKKKLESHGFSIEKVESSCNSLTWIMQRFLRGVISFIKLFYKKRAEYYKKEQPKPRSFYNRFIFPVIKIFLDLRTTENGEALIICAKKIK